MRGRGWRRRILMVLLGCFAAMGAGCVFARPAAAAVRETGILRQRAAETKDRDTGTAAKETGEWDTGNTAEKEKEYLDHWLGELDFDGLDELLERELFPEQREKLRFSGIVESFLTEGMKGFDYGSLADWFLDMLFYEMETHRKLLVTAVMLAVAFSVLKNFSGGFGSSYISEISFLFLYCVLAVLLMQSFLACADIAREALTQSTDFMKALVPTLCVSMVFSAGPESSAGFYQLAFLVVYLVQWLFLNLLLPLIHIYVIMELFNHFFEDEKFENLTELLKNGIEWGMKSAGILVLGLNVVQGLISPVKDRLMNGTINWAVSMIPGVGSVINGVGEMIVGSGILIKNCVGAAALVILVVLGMMPVIKILGMSVLYKLAAVLVEPVTDKRIAGCIKGMSEGGFLYLKLVAYCVALLFLTVALTTAASGFFG